MSKLLKNFVGIDISKSWFDVAVVKACTPSQAVHHRFDQTLEGFEQMQSWLLSHEVASDEYTLFCMEYTGVYNGQLVNYLNGHKAQLWVEMALRIKRASGFQRGCDDKTAALTIALYAYRHQDQMQLWQPLDTSLETIRHLVAQRDRLIQAANQLEVPVEELKACGFIQQAKQMQKLQQGALKQLLKSRELVEARISELVKNDQVIAKKMALIQSVKGIGPVTAISLLIYTRGFTSFGTAKQLACYCGVVPFTKQSGSSVRSKAKVSQFANMKLKRLLHLCATSAINHDKELKLYFERKILEGKNKMSVINAVRNKLVHRVFAVIRDERMFEENYVRKCA